jgi:hypothetical protein
MQKPSSQKPSSEVDVQHWMVLRQLEHASELSATYAVTVAIMQHR